MLQSLLRKCNTLLLGSFPVFSVYAFTTGISLASFICLLLLPLNLFFANYKKVDAWTVWLIVEFVFIGAISVAFSGGWANSTLYLHNLFPTFIFLISVTITLTNINIRLFVNIIYFIGIIAATICIFQRIELITTGAFERDVYFIGLPLIRDFDTIVTTRPSSFFTEPAHLSIYLLPIFYMGLVQRRILVSITCTLGIICSGSLTGFLIVILLLIYRLFKVGNVKKKAIFIILCAIAIYVLLAYMSELIDENINKIADTNVDKNIRLLGATEIFSHMNILNLLFGLGLNQLEGYASFIGLDLKNYSNAILFSFISFGIIGFISFVLYLLHLYKISKLELGFFIILIGILCSDQVLFNANFIYPLTFVLLSNKLVFTLQKRYSNESIK